MGLGLRDWVANSISSRQVEPALPIKPHGGGGVQPQGAKPWDEGGK